MASLLRSSAFSLLRSAPRFPQLYIFSYTAAGRRKRASDVAAKQARLAAKAD